jgi:hypothetical protein
MGINPPPTLRSRQEILASISELANFLKLNRSELERLAIEVQNLGNAGNVQDAVQKLLDAERDMCSVLSYLRGASTCLTQPGEEEPEGDDY